MTARPGRQRGGLLLGALVFLVAPGCTETPREGAPASNGAAADADTRPRPNPARSAPRVVVEARRVRVTPLPPPHVLKEYPRALVAHQYEVVQVLEGSCPSRRMLVAHWAIRNGQVLPEAAQFREGQVCRLTLERYDDHPELQPERLIQDTEWLDMPLYYDVEWLGERR